MDCFDTYSFNATNVLLAEKSKVFRHSYFLYMPSFKSCHRFYRDSQVDIKEAFSALDHAIACSKPEPKFMAGRTISLHCKGLARPARRACFLLSNELYTSQFVFVIFVVLRVVVDLRFTIYDYLLQTLQKSID